MRRVVMFTTLISLLLAVAGVSAARNEFLDPGQPEATVPEATMPERTFERPLKRSSPMEQKRVAPKIRTTTASTTVVGQMRADPRIPRATGARTVATKSEAGESLQTSAGGARRPVARR